MLEIITDEELIEYMILLDDREVLIPLFFYFL